MRFSKTPLKQTKFILRGGLWKNVCRFGLDTQTYLDALAMYNKIIGYSRHEPTPRAWTA